MLSYSLSLREKCPNTELFLVRIFPHSDWIERDISPYSVRMRENTDQKKLRIWTFFTMSYLFKRWIYYRSFKTNFSENRQASATNLLKNDLATRNTAAVCNNIINIAVRCHGRIIATIFIWSITYINCQLFRT